MTIDDQVNGWLLEKFFESNKYSPIAHGEKDQVTVVTVDMGWDCGCYSSWTRDDTFEVTAKLNGKGGNFEYRYGYWADFPQFIEELDEYINGNHCRIDEQEREHGSY